MNQFDLEENCIFSIENNKLEKLEQYLSTGYNVNSNLKSRKKIWDTNCFTILSIAAYSGSVDIVEFLLRRNVKINQADMIKQRTALHWSVAARHYDIAKMLIDAGALVNAQDRDLVTPLILAANVGDLATLRLLISHGANVNMRDRVNLSALHYACMRSHAHIVKELIVNGCVFNANGHQSATFSFISSSPLKYLIHDRQYSLAKQLIQSQLNNFSGYKLEKCLRDWTRMPRMIHNQQQQSPAVVTNKTKQQDDEFEAWLREHFKCPSSLANICRQKIRACLGSEFLADKIAQLPIGGTTLTDYIMMKF